MQIPSLKTLDANQSLIQLALLNFSLIIILIKQIGFLYSIFSFAFIFICTALAYHHLIRHGQPQEDQTPLKLFDQQLVQKVGSIRTGFVEKLNSLSQQHETKKRNTILAMLIVVYFCMIFVNDWIEAFIFLNFGYVYFFMPQVCEKLRNVVCSICNNQCPFAVRKE